MRALVRGAPLGPAARLRVVRRPAALRDGAGAALGELVDDQVSVPGGRHIADRFRQPEVELADGAPDGALDRVLDRLGDAGARQVDRPASKYEQALAVLGHRDLGPELETVEVAKGAGVAELIRHDLRASVRRLLVHDPGVRLGEDPEAVHQARGDPAAALVAADVRQGAGP